MLTIFIYFILIFLFFCRRYTHMYMYETYCIKSLTWDMYGFYSWLVQYSIKVFSRNKVFIIFSSFLCVYLTAGEAFSISSIKRGYNSPSPPPPSLVDLSLGDSQDLGSDSSSSGSLLGSFQDLSSESSFDDGHNPSPPPPSLVDLSLGDSQDLGSDLSLGDSQYLGSDSPSSDLSLGDSQDLGSDSPYSSDSGEEDNSSFSYTHDGISRRPCILSEFDGVNSSTSSIDTVVVTQPKGFSENHACLDTVKAVCVGATAGGAIGCGIDWICSCLGISSNVGLYSACGTCGCSVGAGVGCVICCVGHYWKELYKKDRLCLASPNSVLGKCDSHTDSRSSEGSSSEKNHSTITQTQQCSNTEKNKLLGVDKTTAFLLPGYNYKGQVCSLFGIQHMLLDTSKRISTTVKMLGMKACSSNITANEHTRFGSHFRRLASKKSKHIFSGITNNIPYRITTSLDSYCSNMEYKAASGQMGVLFDLWPTLTAGFIYGRHNDRVQKTNGMQGDLKSSSVSTRKKLDSLSAVVAWNTKKNGFIGHIVTYYGWGTVTNIRSVPHADCMVKTKGTSEIQSIAGLIQLGYNLQLSSEIVCIPYVEYMFSSIRCAGYQEYTGILPSKFTRNNEQTQEKSIGLRSQYKVSQNSQLQGWISYVSGQYHFAEFKSTLLGIPNIRYSVSIPSYKKEYSGTEIGMIHESKLTSRCTIGAHMIIHLYHNSVYNMYTGAQIRYHY
ncbi:hypothetical protein DR192_06580 [Lawsonia intracellularis]|nr:hypothetical protein DR192_06580 [Lawsonia intracellularis]